MNRLPSRRSAPGPGVVYLFGSLSPHDIIAHSIAGATYGYSLLWVLLVAYGLHYCIAEASSRYVIATGESIMEGFGRLGRPVVFALAGAIFIRRHLNNLVKVLLLGVAAHLLVPLPTESSALVWSVLSFAAAFWLMFRGGYSGVEAVSRVAVVVLAGSLLLVAAMAGPDPAAIARGLVPSYPEHGGPYSYMLILMAVAGTTVGSINHLKYPAYVYEKGWRSPAAAVRQRADLVFSIAGKLTFAVVIQVAAAATLYGQGVDIRTIEDLSLVFSGPLGDTGRIVLGVGMWAAAFMSYVESNTGYSLLVADAYERFVRRRAPGDTDALREEVRGRAYRVLLTFFCVSSLYVLFTTWEPFWLAVVASALFFVLTPLLLAGLLVLTGDRVRMRGHASSPWSRAALAAAMAAALFLTWQNALEVVGGWGTP
jgi:Mn2+/Fe2+ NRAMP family transporter